MHSRFSLQLVIACTFLLTGAASAWPGFNWDEWKAGTACTRIELDSPQKGLPDLLPLLKNTPDAPRDFPAAIAWKKKQQKIELCIRKMLGEPGQFAWDLTPSEVLGEELVGDYIRQHLSVSAEQDDRIPAYMLIPKNPITRPTPVMIVLHQTQSAGKREACGMEGDPEMAIADELAKRGYVCIVPDAIGFGERIPEGGQPYDGAMDFFKAQPDWSFFGKMTWDVGRIVDYLHTRSDLDKQRIGIIGHSHGAYGSIMAAALESRISLVVASCGLTTFRTDPKPERWSHLTPLMPIVGLYLDDIAQIPTDWHEIAACIAPRPFFNYSTLDDTIFPNSAALADVYKDLESLYKLYNMEGRFHGELAPGEHRFPKEAREAAYAFIDEQFEVNK